MPRTFTIEHRAKLAAAKLGKHLSEAHKDAIAKGNEGKMWPEGSRIKPTGRPRQTHCKNGHLYTQSNGRNVCWICKEAKSQLWLKNHPEAVKHYRRKGFLKNKFGLSHEQYQAILVKQDGKCAICREPLPEREENGYFPPVDHDHITGRIRGIAHTRCNQGIGMFKDNSTALRRAADHVELNRAEDQKDFYSLADLIGTIMFMVAPNGDFVCPTQN